MDLSFNPLKKQSQVAFYSIIPLTTIRQLSLACVSIAKDALQLLHRVTDQSKGDASFLLDHLNLSQACTSEELRFNVAKVHYTDCVVIAGEKLDECHQCCHHRLVTIQADGESVLINAPRLDKIWSLKLVEGLTDTEDVVG